MKKRYIFALVSVLALGAVFMIFYGKSEKALAPIPTPTVRNDSVIVASPRSGETITSPYIFRGEAKGMWYFEATFPVKVVDLEGKIIGRGIAHADGDWMTENFVPFSGTIEFAVKAPASATGYGAAKGEKGEIIFEKDNPSGLPQNAGELRVPVIFGSETTMPVSVFFGNSAKGSSEDCSKVFPVTRQISKTSAVARGALNELLKGTTETDLDGGYFTSINAGVKIQKLTIENGVAEVDLSNDIEKAVGGSCRVTNIRAQIEKTLLQFPAVKSVIISVDGRTEDILQP